MHHKKAQMKFRYEVFGLRDKLRVLAYENPEIKRSWIFDFMDKSFSKAACDSYHITLVRLILLHNRHRNDMGLQELSKQFNRDVREFPALKKLSQEYISGIRKYIFDQHYVSAVSIILPIMRTISFFDKIRSGFRKWIKDSLVFPEMSASGSFAKVMIDC